MRTNFLGPTVGLFLASITFASTTQPDDGVWQALSAGKQSEAESQIATWLHQNPKDAHALFLAGLLTRSRFDKSGAAEFFKQQVALVPAGDEATAAKAVLAMDSGNLLTYEPAHDFATLNELMKRRTDDGAFAWLMAIECRTYRQNDDGIVAFTELGKHFTVGPVLFHQTFANLLDEQGRYKESLPHRQMAVKLEPEPWSWSGLGDTYWRMNDAKSAVAAYQQAVKLDDTDTEILGRLADNALKAKDAASAEAAGKRLVELEPNSTVAHAYLGKAFRLEGDDNKVADEMKAICKLRPTDRAQAQRAVKLLRSLGRNDEADALDR